MNRLDDHVLRIPGRAVVYSRNLAHWLCLVSLVGCWNAMSRIALPADDVVLTALADELQRSMKLRVGDLESPYFVQYAIDDSTNYRLSATYGALVSSTPIRSRTLYAQVRVGSYEIDNSNFVGRGGFGGSRGLAGSVELPTDQNYEALRHSIWIATDALYKGSVATLAQKRAYLRDRNVGERPKDFTKVDAMPTAVGDLVVAAFDKSKWEEYARSISKTCVSHPQIQDEEVSLVYAADNRYLVNSEGCRLRYGETGAMLRITAEVQASDGQRMSDSLSYYVTVPEQLPELASILQDVSKFLDRLEATARAPILDDYTGPVLVDGLAAGQLIRQLMAQGLTSQVEPVGLPRRNDEEDLESRLGKRILPTSFRIYDDPRQSQFQDTFLAGHYAFDDEGAKPERVDLVVDGKLEGMVTSRTPDKPFVKSNGHGRRGSSSTVSPVIGCLYVEANDGLGSDELKQELIDAAKAEGLKFGLRISSLQNRTSISIAGFPGGFPGGFGRRVGTGGGRSVGDPIAIYKVDVADGREEPVRACEFGALDLRSLRRIIAAGKDAEVHNSITGVASSVVAPALLFEELELSGIKQESERKPILPAPHARPVPPT